MQNKLNDMYIYFLEEFFSEIPLKLFLSFKVFKITPIWYFAVILSLLE